MKRKCNQKIGKLLGRGKMLARGIRKRCKWERRTNATRAKTKRIILEPNRINLWNLENIRPYQCALLFEDERPVDYRSSDYLTSEQQRAEQNVLLNNLKMLEEVSTKSYQFYADQVGANNYKLRDLSYKQYLNMYKAYEICYKQCEGFS